MQLLSQQAREFFKAELQDFVPRQVWDSHVHVSYAVPEFKTGAGLRDGEDCTAEVVASWDRELLPGCQMRYSFLGFPYLGVDAGKMARYTIDQTELFQDLYSSGVNGSNSNGSTNPVTAAFPVVSPDMDLSQVEEIARHPVVAGFKPYRLMSSTGDVDECSITDFLPEEQIEVADKYGLIILLHMSKRRGPEDPENIKDLKRLTKEYPRVKWQLAHCARSFNPLFLEQSISELKKIPNLWYDTSAVCESEVFDILFGEIPVERILYGSDHIPGHVDGGKYVAFGRGWMWLNPKTADMNLTHCDPGTFPMVYEELRAMKNAMKNAGYGDKEKEAVFFSNTKKLMEDVLNNKG